MGEAAPQAAAGTGMTGGESTPEALAAEHPQWRKPARAGDAWITMRSGPQEYHGPESLIMRTLSAQTIGELAEKLRFQAELDGLTPGQLAAVWRDLRRPAPESAAVR
jgi:hypothetical protein